MLSVQPGIHKSRTFFLFDGEGAGSESWITPLGEQLVIEDAPGGQRYVVDMHSGCPCGHRPGVLCKHERRARDVWMAGKGELHTLVKSCLHKEIRRGNVPGALLWARWAGHYHGWSWPKNYVRRLLLEEGRSVELCKAWLSLAGIAWYEVVAKAAAMKKKWEMVRREGVFAEYVEAFAATEGMSVLQSAREVQQAMDRSGERRALFRVFWQAQRSRNAEGSRWLIDALKQRALEQGGVAREWVTQALWQTTPFYGPKVLMEMLTGAWGTEANAIEQHKLSLRPALEDGLPVVPAPPDYVYDCHDPEGRRRLLANWSQIGPGRTLPSGIDLRWSGMLAGVCWREYAARQYGERYCQARWEEVEIEPEVWDHAMACDRFFYVGFYKRLGISG